MVASVLKFYGWHTWLYSPYREQVLKYRTDGYTSVLHWAMKTQLQSPSHWCCKGWCNHCWMSGSSESSSGWCSCLCQILWETETKWYLCFQALSPNRQEFLPQSMTESLPGHLITFSQSCPWGGHAMELGCGGTPQGSHPNSRVN